MDIELVVDEIDVVQILAENMYGIELDEVDEVDDAVEIDEVENDDAVITALQKMQVVIEADDEVLKPIIVVNDEMGVNEQ